MKRKYLWGIVFVLAAIALVVVKVTYTEIDFWSLFFSIVFLAGFIGGLVELDWGRTLFSAAIFIIINDEFLHMEQFTPWTVLGVALLGTIGLGLLFPGKKKKRKAGVFVYEWTALDEETMVSDAEVVEKKVVCGNATEYIQSQDLREVNLKCVCGEASIYLHQATLANNRAKINVHLVMGEAHVYVPEDWTVVTDVSCVLGGEDNPIGVMTKGENKILIDGKVVLGEIHVHYIRYA